MIEDKTPQHEFLQIVNREFSVSERKLLSSLFDTYNIIHSKHRYHARRWASKNLPDYLKDDDTPVVEIDDAMAFAIEGFYAFQFADTHLRTINILDEMLTELTEADNDADIPTPENDPGNG